MPAVVAVTVNVLTGKFADEALAGTVIEFGSDAAGFALARLTMAPPAGAAPDRVTVPVANWPPVMLDGLILTDAKDAGAAAGGL